MKYILLFLFTCLVFAIGSSLYIYHGHHHDEEVHEGAVYAKDDVVVDFFKSMNRDGREKVICYRESHRNFYVFIFQMTMVILALTVYGIVTKVRLSNRLTRQNKALEESRAEVAAANNSLRSGIRYAQRIQQAMLPTMSTVQDLGQKGFIFYQPKDVVSGDFYWVGRVQGRIVLCAADCTGHGVPGAFLATLGLNCVRTVLESEQVWQPSEILRRVNALLTQSLGVTSEGNDADGIEMSVFCLDEQAGRAQFAGGKGVALHIAKDGTATEMKGDRISLGHFPDSQFAESSFPYQKGDWFFQFSDGFADQFGGPENKKFTRSRLRSCLKHYAESENPQSLQSIFQGWKGDYAQVDDVLVIGLQAA